jgi:hypothetical protein
VLTHRTLRLAIFLTLVTLIFPACALAQPTLVAITLTPASYTHDMVVNGTPTATNTQVNATMDNGTIVGGNTWYARGQNTSAPTTGLPMGTTFAGASNPNSAYTLRAADVANAILLDGEFITRTLTLATPTRFTALSFLTSSGNGQGNLTVTVNFADGFAPVTGLMVPSHDWFNNTVTVAYFAAGRMDMTNFTYNSVNSQNPRLYERVVTLPAAAGDHPISTIVLAWTGGPNTHTAVFAVSGTPIPEPATLALATLSLGAPLLGSVRRLGRRRPARRGAEGT